MNVEGAREFDAPRERVWAIIQRPRRHGGG